MFKGTVIGNLGGDPEMRYTAEGQAVCNFSVASNETRKGVKETTWVRVTAWGKLAEACNQYLKKGSKVYAEGKQISDPKTGGPQLFESKNQPGTVKANFEIMARDVQFLDKPETGVPGRENSEEW
jgi:single-strand DNA-binding protein